MFKNSILFKILNEMFIRKETMILLKEYKKIKEKPKILNIYRKKITKFTTFISQEYLKKKSTKE